MFVKSADPRDTAGKHDKSMTGVTENIDHAGKESCGLTIEVHGLKSTTRASDVIKYFEEQCGGQVDGIQRDTNTNVIFVTFERKTG